MDKLIKATENYPSKEHFAKLRRYFEKECGSTRYNKEIANILKVTKFDGGNDLNIFDLRDVIATLIVMMNSEYFTGDDVDNFCDLLEMYIEVHLGSLFDRGFDLRVWLSF